jgi:hypothetical protein
MRSKVRISGIEMQLAAIFRRTPRSCHNEGAVSITGFKRF